MLDEIDEYIREHQGVDRSQIVDEALRCWYASQLSDALTKQHSAERSSEESEERSAWRRIRQAQAARHVGRHRKAEEA
jgi:hypothetical protein